MAWWNKEEEDNNTNVRAVEKGAEASSQVSGGESKNPSYPGLPSSNLDQKYGAVRSALSDGTVIQGKLSFDTPVRIDGNLVGEVFSSSVLIVGPKGSVSADVNVETLVVLGSVSGDIRARKRLELHASGELIGSVETPSLVVEDGAYFEGACSMKDAPEKARTEKQPGVPVVKRNDQPDSTTSSSGNLKKNSPTSSPSLGLKESKSPPAEAEQKSPIH